MQRCRKSLYRLTFGLRYEVITHVLVAVSESILFYTTQPQVTEATGIVIQLIGHDAQGIVVAQLEYATPIGGQGYFRQACTERIDAIRTQGVSAFYNLATCKCFRGC